MEGVEEVTTLEIIILVTLGITILTREKIDLGLKVLVLSVVKKDIELLNVTFLVRVQEVVRGMS